MDEITNVGKLSLITQVGKVRGIDNALANTFREGLLPDRTEPTQTELATVMKRVNESLQVTGTDMVVKLDKETDRKIVQFVNKISGDVVKQFPAREFVEWEREYVRLLGILFDQKV